MSQQTRKAVITGIGILFCSIITFPGSTMGDELPTLVVSLSDTVVNVGATDAWISVYFRNFQDTVAGLTLWIIADEPDIIEFKTDVEDTILYPGGVDTAGTAISGWQYVNAISVTENRSDIQVTALADVLGPPTQPGLPPHLSPVLLMRLPIRVAEELPFATDSVVRFQIVPILSETAFSDPQGNLIGTITNYNICDTTYWRCLEWDGDSCLAWGPSDPALADSIRIDTFYTYWCCDSWLGDSCANWSICLPPGDSVSLDSVAWLSLDTANVFYGDGHVRVVPDLPCCQIAGDINNDGLFNVGDPVFLISYIFKGGPPPSCPQSADVNGDCQINAGDVVAMIWPIFIYPWESPHCGPDTCSYDGY